MQAEIKRNAKVFSTANASLRLARSLAVAAHDLHPVRIDGSLVVEFELDILDQECPDLVAESVGIKVALCKVKERERKSQPDCTIQNQRNLQPPP